MKLTKAVLIVLAASGLVSCGTLKEFISSSSDEPKKPSQSTPVAKSEDKRSPESSTTKTGVESSESTKTADSSKTTAQTSKTQTAEKAPSLTDISGMWNSECTEQDDGSHSILFISISQQRILRGIRLYNNPECKGGTATAEVTEFLTPGEFEEADGKLATTASKVKMHFVCFVQESCDSINKDLESEGKSERLIIGTPVNFPAEQKEEIRMGFVLTDGTLAEYGLAVGQDEIRAAYKK